MKLVLASSSSRRKDLLALIGVYPDHIVGPAIDETPLKNEDVRSYVKRIANLKAQTVHTQTPHAYVLAADTVVERGHRIILKAQDQEDAKQILKGLSGRRHRVYSAVCLISPQGKEALKVVLTRVSFKRLTETEIEEYLQSKEWEGASGAYAMQGKAAQFIKFISGSHTNVVGLPLYETVSMLRGLGFLKS